MTKKQGRSDGQIRKHTKRKSDAHKQRKKNCRIMKPIFLQPGKHEKEKKGEKTLLLGALKKQGRAAGQI